MLHVLILLNISNSTLWHCSQPETRKGTLFLNALATTSSWTHLTEWKCIASRFLLDTYLRLRTLVPSLSLELLRLAMRREKWDLGSLNHPRKMQHGSSLHEAVWRGLCCRAAGLVGLLLWVLVLSNKRTKRLSLQHCSAAGLLLLCGLWRKIVPSAELTSSGGRQWVYSSLHLGR